MNWDEAIADIVAHYATNEYPSCVSLHNKELSLRVIVYVHEDMVNVSIYSDFNGRLCQNAIFTKDICYSNPNAFDGSLTEEIEEAIDQLPKLDIKTIDEVEIR